MADDLSILSRNPAPSRQIRFATHIFVHPGYDDFTYANDIAIVRVSVPFTQTATLRAVPRSTFTPPDNQACHLAGWLGKTNCFTLNKYFYIYKFLT